GMPGLRVDGNDIAAVFAAVTAALERGRNGDGPTLIECLTYRMESHTNSDDPTKYRDAEEVEHWKQFDPIDRVEKYLRSTGALDDAGAEEVNAAAEALAESVREAMNREAEIDPRELFAHVYAQPRPDLAVQQLCRCERLYGGRLRCSGAEPCLRLGVDDHVAVQGSARLVRLRRDHALIRCGRRPLPQGLPRPFRPAARIRVDSVLVFAAGML